MTVGIVLSNGLKAFLLCDEMATAGGRQSISFTKMGQVKSENYHGALVGAGSGNLLLGVITEVSDLISHASEMQTQADTPTPEAFVNILGNYVGAKLDTYDRNWLQEQVNNVTKKAEVLYANPEERGGFLATEKQRIGHQFDQYKEQQQQNQPLQVLVAVYDKQAKRPRVHLVSGRFGDEIFIPHVEIGSGADAAQMYFLENLQGLDIGRLSDAELAFHVACAYMKSTLNVGVGGTPKMAFVKSDKVESLGNQEVAALTNLCGYHLAGAGDIVETISSAASVLTDLREFAPELGRIAGALHTTAEDLCSATIPLSVIRQRMTLYQRLGT